MTEEHREFLDFVEVVCARPALYLGNRGRSDFHVLVIFLDGYLAGVAKCGRLKVHPFGNLLAVLEHAHGFSHPGWGWPRHYVHDQGSEQQAIREFPHFLKAVLEISDVRIEEIREAHGHFTRVPPHSPQTSEYVG